MIRRSSFTWPIILAVLLLVAIVILLVIWIIAQASADRWALLAIGTVIFSLVLVGTVIYFILTIKEIRLNRRQANFIDSVTHELKSPIASIKLCLQTLDMRRVDLEQQREFHRFMLDDVQRLDALIDHLLVVARLDDAGPLPLYDEIPFEPLLRSCAEEITRRYELDSDRIRLEIRPCVVRGSRHDLEMVFTNLIDNAIKYAGDEPQVLVEAGPVGTRQVQARISDNGLGVRFEMRRKIFDRFFRGGEELERTTKGTGLGLYIVRSLVKRMRGKIHIHGRGPLRGATFEVDLPGHALEVAAGLKH